MGIIDKHSLISHRRIALLLLCVGFLPLPNQITFSGGMQSKRRSSTRQAKFEPFGTYAIYERQEGGAFSDFNIFQIGYPRKPVKGQPDKIIGEAQFGKRDILIAEFTSLKLIDTALSFETEDMVGHGPLASKLPGIVKPLIEWTVAKEDALDTAGTIV